MFTCAHACPASEPIEVQGTPDPVPPPGADSENDGEGVRVSIVDTGLMPNAAMGHPWLAGVRGRTENPYTDNDGEAVIAPYAGHGTFVAGILRCMAPKASVFVERAFDNAGAVYETKLASILEAALDRHPDILVFTFVAPTHRDQSLHTFDELYERRIRHMKGMVVLAPVGNDGKRRPMWPAAHPGVIAVGALAANGRERADFTNHGRWVDVYAPGVDPRQRLPCGNLRLPPAAHRGTQAFPRHGDVERDVVQHPAGRRADRRPDVPDRAERPASLGLAAAVRRAASRSPASARCSTPARPTASPVTREGQRTRTPLIRTALGEDRTPRSSRGSSW